MGWMPLVAVLLGAAPASTDWLEFRGPDGVGHYAGKPLVQKWGPDTNVTWKASIPGKGWSSPIHLRGKLYLTTAVPQGDGEKANQSLRALCVDAATGNIDWNVELFVEEGATAPIPHKKNSHASPTAVSDGTSIFVHYGHMGTAKLDLAGKVLWKTQKYTYKPVHGNGGSPILVSTKNGPILIVSCDGMDKQTVLALDTATGEAKWETPRKMSARMPFSFATAQLITVNGAPQIISPASDFVAAYNPENGAEIWRVKYPKPGWSVITRPIRADGLVIIQTGYVTQHLMAIDPTGTGDITETHVKWKNQKQAPNTPTPIVAGDHLYVVSDQGFLSCFEPKTGKLLWSERLAGRAY
ncbi:MAG: PQQ-binding-like beta-propeller repeat protein, partial [Gemmataceae bacterium]